MLRERVHDLQSPEGIYPILALFVVTRVLGVLVTKSGASRTQLASVKWVASELACSIS
jgi:hypothetical protein